MVVSVLCAVHCLALPVAAAALPLVAHHSLHDPTHALMFFLAFPLAAVAFAGGYRAHRRLAPSALGALGIALLAVALTLVHEGAAEVALSIAGGLLLIVAHLANHRLSGCSGCRSCRA